MGDVHASSNFPVGEALFPESLRFGPFPIDHSIWTSAHAATAGESI